jgi:hypothetical protein
MNNANSIKGWVVYVMQLGRAAVVTGGRGRVGAVLDTDKSNDGTFMVAEET